MKNIKKETKEAEQIQEKNNTKEAECINKLETIDAAPTQNSSENKEEKGTTTDSKNSEKQTIIEETENIHNEKSTIQEKVKKVLSKGIKSNTKSEKLTKVLTDNNNDLEKRKQNTQEVSTKTIVVGAGTFTKSFITTAIGESMFATGMFNVKSDDIRFRFDIINCRKNAPSTRSTRIYKRNCRNSIRNYRAYRFNNSKRNKYKCKNFNKRCCKNV